MKHYLHSLSFLCLLGLLGACSTQHSAREPRTDTDVAGEQASAQNEATRAAAIYEEYFEDSLRANPIHATFIGDHRYNDQLPNMLSAEYRAAQEAMESDYLKRINGIDPTQLQGQALLSYRIFKRARELKLQGMHHPAHLIPVNQFRNLTNLFAMFGSGGSAQPFKTKQDYLNWNKRLRRLPVLIDQSIANMREGMSKGIVQPRVLMERTLPQLEAHIVADVEKSIFLKPLGKLPEGITPDDRERLEKLYRATITEAVIPSYRKLHTFIADEYIAACRPSAGLGALPGGAAWYAHLIRDNTTTDMSADEIHRIGLSEVERIHDEMRNVMHQVGFKGTLQDFFAFTKTDKRFYYSDREDLLNAYREFRATVDKLAPKLFDVFPKADYEVRAVEAYREKSAAGASYFRAAPDGSRPGVFYVNTYDLSARPNWAVESLFLHEAAPGHHFQLSIQQELTELPRFRRFGGDTAYIEGWGLYAESLGKELGVYSDPYQYFGALAAELWRAIRLVVDTGLHAKGWSREKVLEYMYANAPVAKARAVSETERFMAIPGQALAYKIGQLKIRELRTRAESKLGDKFDARRYHGMVLKDGSLPLAVLEEKIDAWIAGGGI